MTPERVLILHDYAGSRGGAEVVALDLRQGLRARGIDARLMTTTADTRTMTEDEAPDYTVFGTTGQFRALPEIYNPGACSGLARVLREFRPEVVHVLMFLTSLSPSILRALRDVPVVHMANTYRVTCPTGFRWRPEAGLCTLKAGRACRKAGCFTRMGIVPRRIQMALLDRWAPVIDRRVAPSQAMAEILGRHGWPITDVIPNGIPEIARTGPMADTPIVAYAGRLTAEKGVGWLLDAVAAAGDGFEVDILGDGPERGALEAQAQRLRLGPRVRFHGKLPRETAQEVLSRAWLQVVPSLWPEPFGLVTAEALMRGTPVLVTDQGAQPEIVQDGRTGWVVPVGDVTAMAERLVDAIKDKARLDAMGKAGSAEARARFGVDRQIESYIAVYSDVLDEKRANTKTARDGRTSLTQGSHS